MTKKKHYFIFVFKYRFRKVAFNNLLKFKKIKNYRLIDLSGPYKYFLFSKLLIFIIDSFPKKFKNITLISCDGLPFIKKNAVNIWFGGTNLKIPNQFKSYKNNIPMIKNLIVKEKNFVNFYPCDLKKIIFKKNFKIVFVGRLNLNNSIEIKEIWKKYNKKIMNNFSLIEDKIFFKTIGISEIDHQKNIYLGLKSQIRLDIMKKINKKFKNELILVGSDWSAHIENSINDNHNVKFVRNLYKGNLCIDIGSRWGNNCLYPRSIEIIESSGMLLQSQQPDTKNIFGLNAKFIGFNSYQNLLNMILMYKKNHNFLNFNYKKIYSLFENNEKNFQTLKKIKKISNKY